MRTVIFDLDGTLADTSGDLIAAANACFVARGDGPQLDPATDAGTALRGGRAMLTLGLERIDALSVEDVDRWYPVLLEEYGKAIATHTVLYPGALAAVTKLLEAGYKVGICTNKPEGLAEQLLQALGIRSHFASLIGADTLTTRKPDAAPYVAAVEQAGGAVAQSCLIGDTVTDRNTARAAGVPCVLVTFGPSGGDMAALDPEALIGHFDELAGVVTRLIG
ncbi:HAD-IA family hydrolase [Puniceibacterium sp. IMCC21224]|uniref:HAD-IA family hydrolase n=1 Tax=Puniceibacterium sp. IMCC21224 TaxID=1618204 RepID=UPI00064E0C7C|nr:HAD-IA family hydrolase [Puniceibacterium sp. IMCC21224]KMK67053.1 haloacid dehalogenase superfamily enzyme, subfamily IA [Puniceibacterium sp. IMCC21224]